MQTSHIAPPAVSSFLYSLPVCQECFASLKASQRTSFKDQDQELPDVCVEELPILGAPHRSDFKDEQLLGKGGFGLVVAATNGEHVFFEMLTHLALYVWHCFNAFSIFQRTEG